MTSKKQISFISAILINLNSIIGVGFFINAGVLTQKVGAWGFICYILGALVLLPIALTMAELATEHPVAGGLFYYSKEELGDLWGFISGWSYFLAKTTSFALLSHLMLTFIMSNLSWWNPRYFPLLHGIFFAALFLALQGGVSIGGKIQYFFTTLKLIPLVSIICLGLFFHSITPFTAEIPYTEILGSLSLVTFALASFEIICSIGHLVENAKQNIYWIVLISFSFVALLYTLFQAGIASALGSEYLTSTNPIQIIFNLHMPTFPWLGSTIQLIVYSAVLGTIFTMLGSNSWNLYALAKNESFPFSSQLTYISSNNIPLVGALVKIFCAWFILLISKNQIALQNMFVLNVSISYGLSVLSCIRLKKISLIKKTLICFPALISCLYLLGLSFSKLQTSGISFSFLTLYSVGIFLYICNKYFFKKAL